ncbi:MAG: hypothetical protein RIS45_545 [Planctomycetota bacterium]
MAEIPKLTEAEATVLRCSALHLVDENAALDHCLIAGLRTNGRVGITDLGRAALAASSPRCSPNCKSTSVRASGPARRARSTCSNGRARTSKRES